jgi:hypothetical protein
MALVLLIAAQHSAAERGFAKWFFLASAANQE